MAFWNRYRGPSYSDLLGIIADQSKVIFALVYGRRPQPGPPGRPPLATGFVLKSIVINNQIKIEGNIMSLSLLPNQYVIGTLQPIAGQDAQGNNILSEIKAGSVVAYTSDNPLAGVITPNPNNPLQFKVQVPATVSGSQTSNLGWSGINDAGTTINGTDVLTAGAAAPALATGFAVSYTAPADATATPAPF